MARIEARVSQEAKADLEALAQADLRSTTAQLEWLIREEVNRRARKVQAEKG